MKNLNSRKYTQNLCSMYSILFFENGRFCTQVGGPVTTLPEAIEQIKKLAAGLNAMELEDYFGYKFDRAGTPCAILVSDRYGNPIRNINEC